MTPYVDPDSFLGRAFIEYIGGGVLGAAAVYAGTYVAPGFKTQVSTCLAVLVLVASGFLLFPAVMTGNYWAILSILCMGGGASFLAYSVVKGEIQFTDA